MSSNADAADQAVSMSLRGVKLVAEITGTGAKNLATYLYAVLNDQKRTRGKIRLEGLLRSGKELKVFAVKTEDLPTFSKEAKRYGVLYCALRDKKDKDGICDIMIRAEDASKINRIVERFSLATADTSAIKTEIEKSQPKKSEPVKGSLVNKNIDTPIDESKDAELKKQEDVPSPTIAALEKSIQSEASSPIKEATVGGTERHSIRNELQKIKAQQRQIVVVPELRAEKSPNGNMHSAAKNDLPWELKSSPKKERP